MSRHLRHIDVQGTQNFRDVGGYRTSDGKRVTMFKHFYRSDELSHVTPDGLKLIRDKLKVKYTIDLRSEEEANHSPYALSGIERVAIPIRPDAFFEALKTKEFIDEQDAIDMLKIAGTPFLTEHVPQMRQFFEVLLKKAKGAVVVVHCTAGKDRTGLATALLLTALGVPEPTVREDYLLTNNYLRPCTAACVMGKCKISVAATNVFLRAQIEFFDAALEGCRAQYGSINNYLSKALDLTPQKIETLRALYTRTSSS